MQKRNILIPALLAALAACQPETPKQTAEPITAAPAAVQDEATSVKPVTPAPGAETPKVATAVAEQPVAPAPAPAPAPVLVSAPVQAPVVEVKTSGVLSEADALALAKQSKCLVCHALDKKLVGPAWRDVAAKYRGDAGAEARLMDKVAKGGKGVWGAIAMPASPQVNEGDRRKLVQFILSLK